ncbi:hypothetical protein HPC49_08050 [Pyxidicoccus fallax]|uniref:Uncharacterized protein n=1 Tax=Pyxidicoccus fallax TaxID=394095 RepID=A0A848LJ78_9BACT|nr:hypothetical protein [Pyxidicoccus fallax]NMO17772.1 hypothetical protein [Pyxidicoccus fallax]NPC78205.1 hypothetical protein [Pyxidicoccus fallax]
MQLCCAACAAPYHANDVSLALKLARCHACDVVYDLAEREGPRLARAPREPSPKLSVPRFFNVEETEEATRISWTWFRMEYLIIGGWGFALDVFSTALLARGLSNGSPLEPGAVGFLCLMLAAGLALTYCALTGFLNKTTIEAREDRLVIRHGPLPWPGNLELSRGELKQLYGKENARRPVFAWHGQGWNLNALDAAGRKRTLLHRLEEPEQVLYLEQQLEKRLGIEDAPVKGELASRHTLQAVM